MPKRSPMYKGGDFQKVEEITPDMSIDSPVWCVAITEPWRRKKTVFVSCPACYRINRLAGRAINDRGDFSGTGCFICPHCKSPFYPFLSGWTPDARDLPKKSRKKTAPKEAE